MKKILLTLATTVISAVFFTTASHSEVAISGYMEFLGGSADQATALGQSNHGIDKGGMSDGLYSKIFVDSGSTMDNGIEVNTHFTLSNDCTASTGVCNTAGPNSQDITFSGGFGAIAVGNTAPAGQRMHSRLTAANPGFEPDGANYKDFMTMSSTGTFGDQNEVGYAHNALGITFMSNVYDGFSVGLNYVPSQSETYTGDGSDGQTATYTAQAGYNDKHEVVLKYATEIDSIGIAATYGYTGGNAGTQGTIAYNDLTEHTMSLELSFGGFTADVRTHDKSDSGRVTADGSGGNESISYCGKYVTGAVSMAACRIEDSFQTSLTTDNERDVNTISGGYSLGGGVNVSAMYISVKEVDDVTTHTDASMILGILTVGF